MKVDVYKQLSVGSNQKVIAHSIREYALHILFHIEHILLFFQITFDRNIVETKIFHHSKENNCRYLYAKKSD